MEQQYAPKGIIAVQAVAALKRVLKFRLNLEPVSIQVIAEILNVAFIRSAHILRNAQVVSNNVLKEL
jgi:hypothetical protein